MNYQERFELWQEQLKHDKTAQSQLQLLNENEQEKEDAFYQMLEFGTAGLRGKLGIGTNRMNFYMVGRATQGIANYILKHDGAKQGVAIAFDPRHFSKEFAFFTAEIFAGNGIKVYLYNDMRSTPQLSYTISQYKTISGINITASHNPKEYSGYKVYWNDGAQVSGEVAKGMTAEIEKIDMFVDIKQMEGLEAQEKGLITILSEDIDEKYLNLVQSLTINKDIAKDISIVYTPLNGAGRIPLKQILQRRGFTNIHLVAEQEHPDPNFTTVGYPNPEDTKAFAYAERLGKEVGAELLIATDPDADRIACEIRGENGEYVPLNGNQVGVLLIKYILEAMKEKGRLPQNGAMVKSIVTGDMGRAICEVYGVKMLESLTGFKNICGKIPDLKRDGYVYLFGYEESIGYAPSEEVRDKDGIATAMLLCELAGYYKKKGKTLLDVMEELFQEYGYYQETQVSLVLEGMEGAKRISRMMETYHKEYVKEFDGIGVEEVIDYIDGYADIPASDVLKFKLEDGSWYALRPSGTEPKIKLYIYVKGGTKALATQKLNLLKEKIVEALNQIA